MNAFTPWCRFRLWCWRYIRLRDLLQMGMFAVTGVLAVNTYSVSPQVTLVAGGIYFVLLLFATISSMRGREARDHALAEVLWGLFSHMNREIFNDDGSTRFTLFLPSRFDRDSIMPWYRYRKGAEDPIAEAQKSKARYRRGEGVSGLAWAEAGGEMFCAVLPEFKTRTEFEAYSVDTLGVARDTVHALSDYMTGVRTLFSFGFTDARGKLLGILSLDARTPLADVVRGDKTFEIDTPAIDARKMYLIVRLMQNVLESFSTIERRNSDA